MHTRRPLSTLTKRLAAAVLAGSALLGAVPASAQICTQDFWPEHLELQEVAAQGGSWVGGPAGPGPVPTLRFRLDAGCAEVMAPGWDWMSIVESPEIEDSYEGSVSRRSADGVEVVDIRFRFMNSPEGVKYLEYETWHLSAEDRRWGNEPTYRSGTLKHRR
ncbi:MAG: hypothetical protein ABW252_01790 [Polyangiales bacterium]